MVPLGCLRFVIVVFPDYDTYYFLNIVHFATHFSTSLFDKFCPNDK